MGCVNVSSREFKDLAIRNNVDANALELITHKYWIEKGSEDLFPTDVYIQAQLGKTQYQEKGKSVRKLWKKSYSTPMAFDSMSALQRAQSEALKFFPPSALVHYKNAKGEYVLTVRQPVERVNHSAVDFFEESFPNNVGKVDLDLDSNETYTLDKVQELYDKFNTDRRSKQLAEKVFGIAKDLGLKITFNESLPFNNFGRYTNDNTIVFKKSFFERNWMNDLKAPILLHEVIHSLTMYALSNQTKRWEKPETIEKFITEMNSVFQDVRGHEALKGERGVTELKEFVAELANPIFRQKLQSIDKKNIWQRIFDAIKNFFGIEAKSTYYNRAMNALDEALNAFDLDMYLRYNGARKLMGQGYRAEEWNFRDMTANELRDAVKQYYYDTLPLNLELSSETKQRMKDAEAAAKTARNNFTYAQENDDTGEMQKDAVNERMQQFLNQYGDLVKTIVPFSNKKGGMSFSVKFKTPKELIDQQNAPLLEQISIIDTMSDDDLFSTFALIEQEFADYELVNGEEEKPKGKSEHTGPQPFTFKDGTVINAPFKPNAQQVDALNAMDEFIHSDETSMTLSGYAGTGKTSLMEMLAKKMQKEHKRIVFSATTNKAAAVLKTRVERSGFNAYTLNKVFGISVEVDSNKAYNARNLVNVLKDSDLVYPGDIVVIDEASMINEENYKILNQIAEQNGLKIIYVGDKAQLAPVNETQVSKVFRNGEGTVIELTQVERTDDNAILKEATDIRNGKRLSGESSFNEKGEGVAYIPKDNKKAIGDVVRHYVQGLQNDPNFFRILAYTNDAVTKYNEAVRKTLGYEGNTPHVGEPMTGYANWGYDYRTKSYRFINSESYKVVNVGKPKEVSLRMDTTDVTMTSVPITLEDSMGKRDTFDFMDIKGNAENRKAATLLAQEKARLWEKARQFVSREAKAQAYQQINIIDSFLFVNDNIIEGGRTLQAKTIDFGYALTIHKSQGSTFTHVLMDDVDVQKANTMSNSMENAMSPVDLGEVGQDASNAELRSSEEVDLGDLSSIPTETTAPNQNLANVRQQLEYVGVSRATNTVTIISNNIKKEDSPLNHIPGNEAIKEDNSRSINMEENLSNNQAKNITEGETANVAENKVTDITKGDTFVSYPLLMENLGKETGERLIQVDTAWKEQELKNLDRDLGQAQDSAIKEAIISNIYDVAHAKERISLPNYEYFTDKYEDTLVDAEWKIPMLEELDAKISTEKDEEFNTAIINQMDAILQAKSEEEYHSAPKAQETVQQNLSEFDKLTTQINNLLDSNEITASEIRHIAELVVNSISDAITDIQKGTLNPKEEFVGFSTDKDMQNVSRREIVEAVGINRLIDRAKNNFDPENANYEDLDTIMQAELITNNWDAIMTLASDIFAANEGFGIGKDYSKGGFQMVNNITQEFDSFNTHEDTESIEETEGDEQEHWQIESRTIDVLNSMSALVRLALHECYQLDKNGNKIVSKWGIAERVNPRKTVNSILRWTQGSLSLEDMVKKLSDKATQNTWLTQLIERLSDTSGKETDFQSQFYGVFSKHFQPYSIVLLEDGKYASIPVNSHPALSEAMNTITTQYKVGSHALFTNNGINKKLLGTENTTYPEADFNLHKALASLNTIMDRLNHGENLDESMANNASANIMGVCRIMGYPVAEEMLQDVINKENLQKMTHALGFIVKSLDAALQAQQRGEKYNPFAFGTDNNIGGTLRNFLTPITEQLEDTAVNAFYDSGKMYQSYITPSFMTKLMNKFRLEGQEFEDFIMDEYGNSEWFKFSGGRFNTGWRNEWLRLLATDENARKVFDHKVELNFNKHNYMRNMSDAEYTLSLITEYFAETAQKGQTMVPAWFRIPMLSNKPSSEFIKFYSYRSATYKDEIVNGLYNMFLQELSRIQTVKMRGHDKSDAEFIKNFDSNVRKFNFLPFLNEYLEGKKGTLLRNTDNTVSEENARLSYLLQKKADGYEALTSDEEAALTTLAEKAIRAYMENRVQSILDKWQNDGILEAAKAIKGIGEEEEIIRSNVENFLWNDAFASKNILQLTITDIAFYKDAEDLQKRLAQLHAPGTRGNVAATDYEGNRVSDGTYRTFILQDFDNFKSNIIANIAEVFDKKIAAAPENQKAGLKALKESLVGENGKYTKINVADAQGYSSPASYRKKAFIFGRWSRQAESIYQKLKKGEYNYTDLETAFQPLKPFVYSHLQKNMGVENAPIHSMPVPFQAKNAEYLLIMADAILQGEELSRPNLLRAVYRVMEESEKLNPTKGIDTVQFESAIKSGLQGRINIHQFANMAGGEEAAFTFMMSQLYKQNADGTRSTQYNTDTFVHEAPFEDYCLQQEVPAHFKEHAQAHGSQIRMIVPSDLDLYKNPNGDLSAEDNQVYYEWTEPDGTKKKVKANDFKKEYEQTIAENIAESINDLAAELHFNSQDKKERNIALSKILQREILSSPRYGVDLIQACSVDKETGEFRIPKGDPIQAKRIEQLINSIIKNRVNKQKIAGGPIVQVSNFGTSRQLHIRFNDKNGNLLMTEEEFNTEKAKDPALFSNIDYQQYVKENQAGIAYFEVFIPLFSKELFDKFSNPDGTINVEAIEATDPELLKMVSYRIPTEDKYSMAPMKAVGFMPKEAGDAIMLPYELTEIDDSDFDVDKRYVMRKDIPIKKRSRAEIEEKLFKKLTESYAKAHEGKTANRFIGEQLRMFLDNPEKMRHTDALMESLYREYQKVAYYTAAPISGRKYRDNKIVDMTLAVLTNEMTADKILNPGGFDAPKKMGYMVAAYKNPANRGLSWEQLQKMSIDELKDLSYTDKDLTWADTQVQFYRQNSAAASLIGVFAVNKVAHATLEGNDIFVAVDEICGEQPFTIIDTEFGYRMPVDAMHDNKGNLIGKTLGSLVSASADAVKDPILNLMNVNMSTAGMLNTMLRLGMTFDDAALFLSQDIIERALNEFNRQNLTNYEPLSNIIEEWLQDYREKNSISDDSTINTEPLTKEELIEGLRPGEEHLVVDYKVLLAFQKLRRLVDAMRKPTFATRFNSISSAVGPLIVDNLIIEHKMEQFMDSNSEDGTHFYTSDNSPVDIDDIFYDHPILKQFARTVDVAKQMFYDMPSGSIGFRNLLNTLPDGLADKLYNDKKLLDQLSNFYQSYLLVQSGMINPSQLKNYIEGFPKWFMDQKFKEKYPENALIQAIKMNVSKRTGRPYLMVNITGMDTQQKEELGNAWIDLHKTNPDLSQKLFAYSFFRAGVGFSPKTFMSLVPTYVKERLETTTPTGKASYVDTYRRVPSVNSALVIDQFIRNNWDNNKLVPKKGGEGTKYIVDLTRGTLIVRDAKDMADLQGVIYMKTRHNGQTYLWKLLGKEEDNIRERYYVRVKPLGNNGEYLEMSLENIQNSLSETTQTVEDMDAAETTEIKETAPAEAEVAEVTGEIVSESEKSQRISDLADAIMKQREIVGKPINKTEATNQIEKMKRKPEMFGEYMVNVFKQMGLDLSKDEAIKEFKKLC